MMLHNKLLNPGSIVVVGGSDNVHSPGGKVLKNLINHRFKGDLFVVNPKKNRVQNTKSYNSIIAIPQVDLAIIAIAAEFIPETVKVLTLKKNTKGFIIFSAGFSEKDDKGAQLEYQIRKMIDQVGGSLLGPNNIGLLNKNFAGIFTTPIPKLNKDGVDFISGSGATAVFIMEEAQSIGLTFSNIISTGNSAQIGMEEVLEYFDKTFVKGKSAQVKMLYLESIRNPKKFLKHALSLTNKGCDLIAIKAGSSVEGNRAATSHTGAMASSDIFAQALFDKAGIIRCYGRTELIYTAGILLQKKPIGKNMAIVTHAGGPAVMLTDVLSKNGLHIPTINHKKKKDLLHKLFDGSSVENPIDFLATGTAEQLDIILDYCENYFDEIDAIIVIYGSPGLFNVHKAYQVLDKKIKSSKKPIYAILPSVINAKNEIIEFVNNNHIAFKDEVIFGKALAGIFNSTIYKEVNPQTKKIKPLAIKKIISSNQDGYLTPFSVRDLLKYAGINYVEQFEINNKKELFNILNQLTFPVVQKAIGPLHKSDIDGVKLNVQNKKELEENFDELIKINGVNAVLIQPMLSGTELFIGALKEGEYPHIIMCGLGGVFVEFLKDIQIGMCPINKEKALSMIEKLKLFPVLKGVRGKKGINLNLFAELIVQLSALLSIAPEIIELDINPLIAVKNKIIAVDARIKI